MTMPEFADPNEIPGQVSGEDGATESTSSTAVDGNPAAPTGTESGDRKSVV